MSNFSLSSDSDDDEFPNLDLKPTINSHSNKLSSNSSKDIEKIIGINQPTFAESSTPIMFYVKYINRSYRECKWIYKKELIHSQRGNYLYKKFLKNPTPLRQVPLFNQMISQCCGQQTNDIEPDEYLLFKPTNIEFDKGFITPEKIISIQKKSSKTEYLVKWVSLDISESTWETDVPENLIDDYEQNNSNTHPRLYDDKLNKNVHKFISFQESPIYKNDHKLADYQINALNWLQMCWFQNRNSILADEMGLGKTIESISILDVLAKWYLSWGPFIVICPYTTINNWLDEFEEWTDFRVVCLVGKEKSREMIKKHLIFHHIDDKNKLNTDEIIFDVLIISYEMLSIELSFIKKFNFMYMIIDEAHRLKNSKSNTYQNCASIRAHHTLLMTGTPIQNDLYELWSLLHFISPSEFIDYDKFFTKYQSKENPETIEQLQEILRPYIFRRKKNDVKLDIPEKEETIIEVEMTQIQRTFSQLIIQDNHDILSDLSSMKISLNNVMMQLRKLFCHPFLIEKLESICYSQYREKHKIPSLQPLSYDDEMKSLIYASGKTILIDKLLPKLKEGNHKVLIFSQMTSMLDILEDYLNYRQYSYERLDGSCNGMNRAKSIRRFQENEAIFVFLLSTRAGGLGINLTKADTVIIYDNDWNPQSDIQAQSRCYRIGQTKKVNVYRLITRGSYESEMFLRASKKLAFDFAILDSVPSQSSSSNSGLMSNSSSLNQIDGNESDEIQQNSDQSKLNSRQELEMILKKGAYYTFKDDPNEIDKFCLENIEQILEHRSHTRKDLVSGGNSKFSKVTFNGTEEQDELNRSDFWDNLIGTNKIDTNDESSSYYGIKTRQKKTISYAENKIKTKEKDDDDEEEEDQQTSSSDDDFDFIPSQSIEKDVFDFDFDENKAKSNQQQQQNANQKQQLTIVQQPQNQQQQQNLNQSQRSSAIQQQNINQHQQSIPSQQQQYMKQTQQSIASQQQQYMKQTQQSISSQQQQYLKQTQQSTASQQQQSINQHQQSIAPQQQQSINQTQQSICKSTLSINLPETNKTAPAFDIPLNNNIYIKAREIICLHGIAGSRFFVSEFVQEIGKTIIALAYLTCNSQVQKKYEKYISEYLVNPAMQIFKTPFREINQLSFLNDFFKGRSEMILLSAQKADHLYKALLYISTEKLPKKYTFVPEMSTPLGWTAVDDYVLFVSYVFENRIENILYDYKLPFYKMSPFNRLSKDWIRDRLRLIFEEVSLFMPKDFKITHEVDSKTEYKVFNDIIFFCNMNKHVVFHLVLTISEQKKILRVLYLYGIPEKDGIKKISNILNNKTIRPAVIELFIVKILVKAIKYKPNLINLLKRFRIIEKELKSNEIVNINWIKKEAIEAVAINLDLFYRIRQNFKWMNETNPDDAAAKNAKLAGLPYWIEILNDCPWWNLKHDKVLFNVTAYYGFFFNSMIAKFINMSALTNAQIELWRNEELLTLTPTYNRISMPLFPIFSINARIKRLNLMLDLIETIKSQSK